MRKHWVWLLVAALVAALIMPLPAGAIPVPLSPPHEQPSVEEGGFCLPGGSLTTTSFDAWGGGDVELGDLRFDAGAGLEVYFFGVDMSEINYDGAWGWPPQAGDMGAAVQVGFTGASSPSVGPRNASWISINSCGAHGAWNDQGHPYTNADGYRSFLFQTWYRGQSGGQQGPALNHQLNAEKHMGPGGDDPECDTLDLYVRVTPSGGGYDVETWSRLHKSSARVEGCPWEWNPNRTTGGAGNHYGWCPAHGTTTVHVTGVDWSRVAPYVAISNWGVEQEEYHTASWEEIVVLGQPVEVWVDDDYGPGEGNDGHFWGLDAFDTIQEGVDAVAEGGTVNVAGGVYPEGVVIDKALTLSGVDEGAVVGAGMVPGYDSYQMGIYVTDPGVTIEDLVLDGSEKENAGLAAQYGVLLAAGDADISGLEVRDWSFGIGTEYGRDVEDCSIKDCALSGISSSGLYFNPGASGNTASDCDIAAAFEGLALCGADENWFEDITVHDAASGIALYADDVNEPSDNTFYEIGFDGVAEAAPTITIYSPPGGSHAGAGNSIRVGWTLDGGVEGLPCDLDYNDEGGPWTGIVSGVEGDAYVWELPDEKMDACRVRVWAVDENGNRVGSPSEAFKVDLHEGGGGGGAGAPPQPPAVAPGVSYELDVDEGGGGASADDSLDVTFQPGAVAGEETVTLTISEPTGDTPPHPGMIRIDDRIFDIVVEDADGNHIHDFLEPITLTFTYDEDDLAGLDPEDLVIYYWDEDLGDWIALPGVVDPVAHTVTAFTDHLTVFALMHNPALPDLPDIAGLWAEADIWKLVSLGIATGFEDGTYRPQEMVTREQFARMIALAIELEPVASPSLGFADAGSVSSWAAGYVQAAVEAGIIVGLDGNRFGPQLPVNRAQAATMIIRALQIQPTAENTAFSDNDLIPQWARGSVAEAVSLGIIAGFEDGSFRPAEDCSRAQVAAMIGRMLEVK